MAFVAIKGDRIMLAQREEYSDELKWDAGRLFFGYNCYKFGLEFSPVHGDYRRCQAEIPLIERDAF